MSVEELANLYGTRTYTTSVGEDLFLVARNIYRSYNKVYLDVLTTLNSRADWDNIPPATDIKYITLNSEIVDQLW